MLLKQGLELCCFKEMLAILWVVKKWKQYLMGRRFTIKTDQRNIKFLLDQRVREESQHPWLQKLNGFDYRVEYKKGKENMVADTLSKKGDGDEEISCTAITIVEPSWL